MLKNTDNTTRHARRECMKVCPEFCIPIVEYLDFLNDDFGFDGPTFKQVSRECWITFNKEDVEIKIGYEPYSLPWGHVTRFDEMLPINDLMNQYGFHLDELKYSEYDEISKKLFALLDRPREADEYAVSKKEQFDNAVAEYVKDLATFFRSHLTEILAQPV
jgi:hypothetical protein